jgi:hypothetical protein
VSKLARALKARFPGPNGPRKAMAAMGLDARLLRDAADPSMREEERTSMRGSRFDPRGHTGGVAGGVRGEDDIPGPEERRVSPVQNEDEEPDEYENFASYLRERGIAEDVIEGAIDYHRRQRGHDHRRPNGRDFQPHNRVRGSEREAPSGGRFGGERRPGEMPTGDEIDDPNAIVDHHGLDRVALDSARKLMGRFGPEVGCRPARPGEMGSDGRSQTMAQRARTIKRFPGLDRIENV